MPDTLLVMRNGKLEANDPINAETLATIREGEQVRCKISRARNPRHHRLYWALLTIVHDNQESFPTVEALHRALKIATGMYDTFDLNGRQVIELRSTDFASMKQDEFSQYYDRVVRLICEKVIPGMDDDALKAQVLEIVEGRTGR